MSLITFKWPRHTEEAKCCSVKGCFSYDLNQYVRACLLGKNSLLYGQVSRRNLDFPKLDKRYYF